MLDWTKYPAVERIPEKLSGEWLFKDTRVPVRALFENLEAAPASAIFWFGFPASSAIR
jgi:uncharacterized protein (DUF433 family)